MHVGTAADDEAQWHAVSSPPRCFHVKRLPSWLSVYLPAHGNVAGLLKQAGASGRPASGTKVGVLYILGGGDGPYRGLSVLLLYAVSY